MKVKIKVRGDWELVDLSSLIYEVKYAGMTRYEHISDIKVVDQQEKIKIPYGIIGVVDDEDGRVICSDKMRSWMEGITKKVLEEE